MKKLILPLFLLLITCSVYPQGKMDTIEGHWMIDHLVGYEAGDNIIDEFNIYKPKKEGERPYIYGNQIQFDDNGTFKSYYTAPCGVDCFPSIFGNYEVVDDNHIRLHLNRISVRGMTCESREEELNLDLGVYLIHKTEQGYRFIRTKEGLTDEKQLHYSKMTNALPQISTGGSDLKWVKLDPNKREVDNNKILAKGLSAYGGLEPEKAQLVYYKDIGSYYYRVFIFVYENQEYIAIYSAGPEIFTIWDK